MNLLATIANTLWSATNVSEWVGFRRALREPQIAQELRLQTYLRVNCSTAFGKAHGLESVRNYEEFARRVPVNEYEALQPWIERIRCGETNVLTREAVTHLIPTSGTTTARKLIPFTGGLQREFNAAIGPWLIDLYSQTPALACGPAYWSLTPVIDVGYVHSSSPDHASRSPRAEVSRSGITNHAESSAIPIGFDSDTAYLAGARKRLIDAIMAVPSEVQRAGSLEAFRYATLLSLLRCRDLRLISVWHPSFLSLLLDDLDSHWETLLTDIEQGGCSEALKLSQHVPFAKPRPTRASELRGIGPQHPGELWPELRLISCWADGPAAISAADLKRRFPNVLLQPKGLIATEAFVTLPFRNHQPLAITSHFFEFLDAAGQVHLAEDLRQGEEYEVCVTTAGGLWRYRLGDWVRVNGFVEKTPSLTFLGRAGNVSDRFGEKLSEQFVAKAMREVFAERQPRFALLAPDEDASGCRYTLYVEGLSDQSLAGSLDQALRRNPHYAYCRDLGQLEPIGLFIISDNAYETFAAHQAAQGARLGDVKPAVLSKTSGWSKVFVGRYLDHSRPKEVRSGK